VPIPNLISWSPKNFVPFDPPDLAKNEGRGERKYVEELRLQGIPARQNVPGQNPDIVIEGAPGREIKQLGDNYRFRASGSEEMMLVLARLLVRPLLKVAEGKITNEDLDRMTIGKIKKSTLSQVIHMIDDPTRQYFHSLFDHSGVDKIVLCYEEGYVEYDAEDSCDCFEIYSTEKFVASIRLKPDHRTFL
jgi:hypothetical protein